MQSSASARVRDSEQAGDLRPECTSQVRGEGGSKSLGSGCSGCFLCLVACFFPFCRCLQVPASLLPPPLLLSSPPLVSSFPFFFPRLQLGWLHPVPGQPGSFAKPCEALLVFRSLGVRPRQVPAVSDSSRRPFLAPPPTTPYNQSDKLRHLQAKGLAIPSRSCPHAWSCMCGPEFEHPSPF